MCQVDELLFVVDGEQGAGVAHGEAPLGEQKLDLAGEFQEAEGVGDGGAVLAGSAGDFVMVEAVVAVKLIEGVGDLDRVQVFALDILDEGDLEELVFEVFLDDGRDEIVSDDFDGAEAAFAGDELVAVAVGTDEDWLDDAVGADRVDEFLEFGGIEDAAGLDGAGVDQVDAQEGDHAMGGLWCVVWRRGCGLGVGLG